MRHHDCFGAALGNRHASCMFSPGAGDGNRTRTISLGICAVRAVMRRDLRDGLPVSDREGPSSPWLMAR